MKKPYEKFLSPKKREQAPSLQTLRETPKLELVTQGDAETEKLIDANVKTMRLAVNGVRRSESLLYAYAAICGAAANRLAAIVPGRSGLLKLLAEKFPDVSENQLYVWRHFADDLSSVKTITPMVGVMSAPIVGKTLALPAKKLVGFQDAIKLVLRGATMVEFHKASQFCGDVQEAGGDRGGSKGNKISDEDAAELLRESVRSNAAETARIVAEKEGLIRLMDDMGEFTKLRMVYHDMNEAMLEMERKARNVSGKTPETATGTSALPTKEAA